MSTPCTLSLNSEYFQLEITAVMLPERMKNVHFLSSLFKNTIYPLVIEWRFEVAISFMYHYRLWQVYLVNSCLRRTLCSINYIAQFLHSCVDSSLFICSKCLPLPTFSTTPLKKLQSQISKSKRNSLKSLFNVALKSLSRLIDSYYNK